MSVPSKKYFVGTSGWSYPQWKDGIYKECPRAKWLSCYAEHFSAVELNSSFYRLPQESYIKRWVENTPADFRFVPKAWKGITHVKRLHDCEEELEECLNVFRLFGKKLGLVLFQLPPSLKRDDGLLTDFLKKLPTDLRFAFEFRSESWQQQPVFELLRESHSAVCHSHLKNWQGAREATSSFLYIRLHGTRDWFKGAYADDFLKRLATDIEQSGKQAYIFFNNTMRGSDATDNATLLNKLLAT